MYWSTTGGKTVYEHQIGINMRCDIHSYIGLCGKYILLAYDTQIVFKVDMSGSDTPSPKHVHPVIKEPIPVTSHLKVAPSHNPELKRKNSMPPECNQILASEDEQSSSDESKSNDYDKRNVSMKV